MQRKYGVVQTEQARQQREKQDAGQQRLAQKVKKLDPPKKPG